LKLDELEKFGPPSISLGGLNIWIHAREFPNATDYWDANWLKVSAVYTSSSSKVWLSGNFIQISELLRWQKELLILNDLLIGTASLNCLEPNLSIHMKIDKTGHIETIVNLYDDHIDEKHEFIFSVDQTYLVKLIKELNTILEQYPLKGEATT